MKMVERVNTKSNHIGDVRQFLELVFCDSYKRRTVIFRGIDCPHKILPTIVRSYWRCHDAENQGIRAVDFERFGKSYEGWKSKMVNSEFLVYERELFKSFKRQARIYSKDAPLDNEWEWLAFAQHYGLPTRLLDWSKNPLAALYFAVCDAGNRDDAWVYIMDFGKLSKGHERMIDIDRPPSRSPFAYKGKFNRYIPSITDARMAAQQSVFTIAMNPFQLITGMKEVKSVVIKGNSKENIRGQLQRLGMNQASLFPDIPGLTENLRWVWERFRNL